ncbi:hypothetical protein [Pseudarthrobacter sp. NPDC058119]|uniref:hypothetical protein n=1 Tax=Pseudarthrobacter sp. NPDC058119 TaxID=3346348 RepID=UPI0036D97A60
MMLLDRIAQLRMRAVAADDEEKIKSRAGEFAMLTERLQATTANAERVNAGRRELWSAGIVQDDHAQNQASALEVAKYLITMVEDLPVNAKFDAVKTQSSTIEAHFKRSEKFVSDAWRSHVPNVIPAVDDDLLNALDQAGVDVESIRSDIESAAATLLTLRSRVLPEPDDNRRLQSALETLNSSGGRIGEVVDPAIADVIVRAQGSGVLYSEMTPEVISGLTELGILDRFRVVLK